MIRSIMKNFIWFYLSFQFFFSYIISCNSKKNIKLINGTSVLAYSKSNSYCRVGHRKASSLNRCGIYLVALLPIDYRVTLTHGIENVVSFSCLSTIRSLRSRLRSILVIYNDSSAVHFRLV